jgi:hypothetical protein
MVLPSNDAVIVVPAVTDTMAPGRKYDVTTQSPSSAFAERARYTRSAPRVVVRTVNRSRRMRYERAVGMRARYDASTLPAAPEHAFSVDATGPVTRSRVRVAT